MTIAVDPVTDRGHRLRRWFGAHRPVVVIAVVLAVLLGLSIALMQANDVGLRDAFSTYAITDLMGAVSFGAVGLLMLAYRPRERLAWVMIVVALGCAVTVASAQYASYGLLGHPRALPATRFAAWTASWCWVVGYVGFVIGVPLLFPTGRLPSRRWRPLAALAGLGAVMLLTGAALAPTGVNQDLPGIANPYAAGGELGATFTGVAHAGTLLLFVSLLGVIGCIRSRWRAAVGQERAQLRWMLLAALTLLVGVALLTVAMLAVTGTVDTLTQAIVEALLVPLVAGSVGIAVVRHRLYDIDLWLNRALVYGVLSIAVLGCYLSVVAYAGVVLHASARWPALLATGVVAVLFQPLRARVQTAINRLFYGQRDEPYVVLTTLSHRLRSAPPSSALWVVADTIREALRVPYAEVAAPDGELLATAGGPAPITATFPLSFGNEIGELRMAGRRPGEPLTPADQVVLRDYVAHAGVAASAGRLALQLDVARQHLVVAREEERRRVARDLHDGIGPQLASYTLTIDAARALLDKDRERADDLLIDLRDQVQCAVDDVRRIARELRPAAIDGRGLVAALADHLDRLRSDHLSIELEIPTALPALDAATEVATYFIVAEAVTNTIRHTQASECTVRLEVLGPRLTITVSDNGCGRDPQIPDGTGLSSMRERAAELGGDVDFSHGSGTRLIARLPVHVARA